MRITPTIKFTIVAAFLAGSLSLSAQSISREVIATSGDYFEAGNISLSWTMGETVIETFENTPSDIILTQGFQQPDLLRVTSVNDLPIPELEINAYPNPTANQVFVNFTYDNTSEVTVELIDLLGQTFTSERVATQRGAAHQMSFDMSMMAAGMYFIKITEKGRLLKTYKIQKIRP